jgi:4-aminobutyrate aminotransferase/(S)-3-amino-2-methylpropionate transaminase
VLVLPASRFGNVMRVLCPLVISDADLERGLDVIEQAVLSVAGKAAVRGRSPSRACSSTCRP